ncbi:MAG: hypothetical protein MI923_14770 [Phycisphaerales bacterium]|nr:hypothetical protein [Phycisphaerales bacterium]
MYPTCVEPSSGHKPHELEWRSYTGGHWVKGPGATGRRAPYLWRPSSYCSPGLALGLGACPVRVTC